MGTIKVTVQRENRLNAISDLASAVKYVAMALSQSPCVTITNNVLQGSDPAISVDTADDVTETQIKETDDGESN